MAQDGDVSLKIAGSYFINCKRTIVFGDQSVMSVTGNDITGRKVIFDLFSTTGALDASFADGKFTGPKAAYYDIKLMENGFHVMDVRDSRIVLQIINKENKAMKRYDLHVWADFYLPNGQRFQCTPDDSNVPFLEMMKGATFQNNTIAIQLK